MVLSNRKEIELNHLVDKLCELLPDWHSRLGVSSIKEYIQEAAEVGLVNVIDAGSTQLVSVRGDREVRSVRVPP